MNPQQPKFLHFLQRNCLEITTNFGRKSRSKKRSEIIFFILVSLFQNESVTKRLGTKTNTFAFKLQYSCLKLLLDC